MKSDSHEENKLRDGNVSNPYSSEYTANVGIKDSFKTANGDLDDSGNKK